MSSQKKIACVNRLNTFDITSQKSHQWPFLAHHPPFENHWLKSKISGFRPVLCKTFSTVGEKTAHSEGKLWSVFTLNAAGVISRLVHTPAHSSCVYADVYTVWTVRCKNRQISEENSEFFSRLLFNPSLTSWSFWTPLHQRTNSFMFPNIFMPFPFSSLWIHHTERVGCGLLCLVPTVPLLVWHKKKLWQWHILF